MNKIKTCFFLCLLLINNSVFAKNKVVNLVSTEYPPYYGENLPNYGFFSEIIKESWELAGYDVKIDFFPWKEALDRAKTYKNVDGLYSIWHSKERENDFWFSDGILPNTIVFMVKKTNKKSLDRLLYKKNMSELTVGNVKGYLIPKVITGMGITVFEAQDDETNIRMLVTDRVDLCVTDLILGKYILKHKFPEQQDSIEKWWENLDEKMQYLAIPKQAINAEDKLKDFNSGLKKLKNSGRFEEILQRL